jgi:hypothetical protein
MGNKKYAQNSGQETIYERNLKYYHGKITVTLTLEKSLFINM